MTALQLYHDKVKPLPVSERLRLASLILNDIPAEAVVDVSDEWSEQDMRDFARAGWKRAQEGDEDVA